MVPLALVLALSTAVEVDLATGRMISEVACQADPSQSYALYLPSGYTTTRAWPVILAFDPGGRGSSAVQQYQAAAERYGFIVAGSNNSRNGSAENNRAVTAMAVDVGSRFQVDPKRVYTAGMSGGARVALGVALSSPIIAGTIASSAGFPDGRARKAVSFPIFATAGTEDFNHLEMRELDHALTSPHHLAIFEGGHVWLSSELAVEAVEWMEVQAMKTGLKARDDQEIDQIFAKRVAAAGAVKAGEETFLALQAIVTDFKGLKDVSSLSARAAELGRDAGVRAALKRDRDEDDREQRMLDDVERAERRLTSLDERPAALVALRDHWKGLSQTAKKPEDSPERRLARRVLSALSIDVKTTDPEYLKIIAEYRMSRR